VVAAAGWVSSPTEVVARPGLLPAAIGEAALDGVDVIAVAVQPGLPLSRQVRELGQAYGVDLERVIIAEKVSGKAGELVRVPVLAPEGLPGRFLLVGTGASGAQELRRAAAALGRAVHGRKHLMTTLGHEAGAESTRSVIEGLLLGGYTAPSAGLKSRSEQAPVRQVTLVGNHPAAAVAHGLAHARATILARDLSETPANLKSPAWLAARAEQAGTAAGLTVQVWDEHRLAAEGFGGVLAVGAGSATPPRFVRLDYQPPAGTAGRAGTGAPPRGGRAAVRKPIVLVGKGITYDTGGISIKPREAMVPMKTDMSGAAAVLAALTGCRDLGVRRPVIGLLPLAENAFGAASYRPSDVVTVRGGTTVEILNTDAEGRMVLADAIAYAASTLDPDTIVDIATLTGAASRGLGRRHAALYATDDALAAALDQAGAASGEHVWRMPLVEEYRPVLDSPIADLRHVPGKGGAVGAGSITAALFLREFTAGRRWAHLDIAGPARSDREEYEVTRGATGFGARLLLRWLESLR
jgi:leucyl aminopeptidase